MMKGPENQKKKFTRIHLGTEEDRVRAEMDERVKNAERWVSKKLSDEDADFLNAALGLDKEILEGSASGKRMARAPKRDKLSLIDDAQDTKRLRGFLELNPYICSGCGTAFQSKSPDSPGFLPKEKLQIHRTNAAKIREQQEAIKILDLAGLEVDSEAAEEVLLAANVSRDIIDGVKKLGANFKNFPARGKNNDDEYTEIVKENKRTNKLLQLKRSLQGLSGGELNQATESVGYEAEGISAEEVLLDSFPKVDEHFDKNRREHYASLQARRQGAAVVLSKKGAEGSISSAESVTDAVCICQRCFRLKQYGQVEETLRPGWSEHELLTPTHFESLLSTVKETPTVVLCLVDVFDLKGSILANLRQIAGKNPIVIAANKVDLLPRDASVNRIIAWIHTEVKEHCGLVNPRDREEKSTKEHFARGWQARSKLPDYEGVLARSNVHLVSCQSGTGMDKLMRSLMALAAENGDKVHVMGAANVGKSSFINRLLATTYNSGPGREAKSAKNTVPEATVSNLPGTTLDFLKIRLPNGVTMIDTPGLINKGQLTSRLTPAELKQVIPAKPINAITLRVSEGKCILLGGLARVELLEARPFFLTFFVSNEIKIHPTDASRADDFVLNHIGKLVFPPATPERVAELGPYEEKFFDVEGDGWKQSKYDIVIAGLGWIAVTGAGVARVKVTVPVGTTVALRPSLLPFEASHSTATFTGGRLLKKSGKSGEK